MEGWIKVHRKIIDSRLFSNPELLKLWLLCLLKASYKERYVHKPGLSDPIKINPGQFVIGRKELHKQFYSYSTNDEKNARTLWRWMKKLERWNCLSIKTTNKYSLITIINWDKYQNSINDVQENSQQVSSQYPAGVQQVSTNNKDKKGKNGKNDKNKLEVLESFKFNFPKQLEAIDGFEMKYRKWWKYLIVEHDKTFSKYSADEELEFLAELNQKGHPPKKVISQSIRNGYKSLYPLHEVTNKMSGSKMKKEENRSSGDENKSIHVNPETVTNTEKSIENDIDRLNDSARNVETLDWRDIMPN